MTDDNVIERTVGDESGRDFTRRSAAAAVGAGAAASGTAAAQQGGDGTESGPRSQGWTALIGASNVKPGARFTFVSGVVQWTPNYGDIPGDLSETHNTRIIRYRNTGETVPIYVPREASLGQYKSERGYVADTEGDAGQPQLYEMDRKSTPLDTYPHLAKVNVTPSPESEEDSLLEGDDD